MTRVKVYPYKMGSRSAKMLARGLGSLRIRDTSNIRRKHVVINWGSSSVPEWINSPYVHKVLNDPRNVRLAVDKLKCFERLEYCGVDCLEYTPHRSIADDWLDHGKKIITRSVLDGHSGAGISVIKPGDELPDARLYTKYRKKVNEYRVFVIKDKIVDASCKRRVGNWRELPEFNKYIRNYGNGWVFCRDGLVLSDTVKNLAVRAIKALGLDFGAVEIGETRIGNAFVIEVNTAPSLDGETTNRRIVGEFGRYLREWL